MEKYTLLEIVQDVLSTMGNDSVSSISDSEDAEDVVKIIRLEYDKMMSDADWKHLKTVRNLTAVGDSTRPTLMKVPTDVAEITDIRYNKIKSGETAPNWDTVDMLDPVDFLNIILERSTDNSNTSSYTTSDGTQIIYYTDRAPSCCASFDDEYIVFDAIDTSVDTTLQASKSIAEVIEQITWTNDDTFVPDMPARMFPTLISRCRVVANELIEQRNIVNDAKDAKSGLNRLRRKTAVTKQVTKRTYGRQTR